MNRIILTISFLLLLTSSVFSQACSCGGAPLLSSLELPATPRGVWQFGLTYEYNSISDLVVGSSTLDDDTRTRSVHSGKLEIGYGLTQRISLLTVFSFLQQEREVNSSVTGGDLLRTRGIGDAVFMVKYSLLPFDLQSQRQLSVGGGLKFPIGSSDLKQNETLIAADMQPGTGSLDGIIWSNFNQSLVRYFPGSVNITTSYSFNGTNDRFNIEDAGYKFGNELITAAGMNYQIGTETDLTMGFRLRTTARDQFQSRDLPNTGGLWLSAVPGINYKLNNTSTARLSGRIPLYRDLNGTQFSTDFTVSISLFYTFGQKEKGII